jgi:hypothetical protein
LACNARRRRFQSAALPGVDRLHGDSAHALWSGVDSADGRGRIAAFPDACPRPRLDGVSPEWLEIRLPHQRPEAVLLRLGTGEREAIVLAQEVHTTLLLMDDMEGREEAERHAFSVVGTLRVLEIAKEWLCHLR